MKKTNATNFRQTPPKNQFSPKLSSFEDTVRNTHLPFHPRKWDAAIGVRFEIQRGAYTLDRTPNKYTPRRSFIPRRDSQGIGSLVTRFSSSFFFFLFLFLFLFFAFLQGREFSTRDSKKGSLFTRTRRERSVLWRDRVGRSHGNGFHSARVDLAVSRSDHARSTGWTHSIPLLCRATYRVDGQPCTGPALFTCAHLAAVNPHQSDDETTTYSFRVPRHRRVLRFP